MIRLTIVFMLASVVALGQSHRMVSKSYGHLQTGLWKYLEKDHASYDDRTLPDKEYVDSAAATSITVGGNADDVQYNDGSSGLAGSDKFEFNGNKVTIDTSVELTTVEGVDYTPQSDQDVDIATVNVTGTPILKWDESLNGWSSNKSINIEGTGILYFDEANGIRESGGRLLFNDDLDYDNIFMAIGGVTGDKFRISQLANGGNEIVTFKQNGEIALVNRGASPGAAADNAKLYVDDVNGAGTAGLKILTEDDTTIELGSQVHLPETFISEDLNFDDDNANIFMDFNGNSQLVMSARQSGPDRIRFGFTGQNTTLMASDYILIQFSDGSLNQCGRFTNPAADKLNFSFGNGSADRTGTGAENVLAMFAGTAPSSNPNDVVQVYAQDANGAGTMGLELQSEDGDKITLGSTITHGRTTNSSGWVIGKAQTQTSGTTPDTAFTIATSSDHSYLVEAKINCIETNEPVDAAGYVMYATFQNVGGTLSQVGATTDVHVAEDIAAYDAEIKVSGSDIIVEVTGDTGDTVDWHCIISYSELD